MFPILCKKVHHLMFPLVSLNNNPLSPNFSEYVLILSLLFYNKMLFGPGCQAWILSLTVEAKALTKWHKCKSTDFPAIDVTHPCKDCWKAIFLQNQYYPPHSLFNIREGIGKWKVNFCGMHNSWRKFLILCTCPSTWENVMFFLPETRKGRNKENY